MANELGFEELSEEELGFEAEPLPPEPESLGKTLVRGTLATLPIVGGVGGGALGSTVAPVAGTAAGGTLGYAGGKQLERLGRKYLLGEDDAVAADLGSQAIQTGGDLAEGAVGAMTGAVASKALPVMARGLSDRGKKIAEFLAERAAKVKDPSPGAGRVLLDEGVVRPFSTAGGIQRAAEAAKDRVGRELGDIVSQIPGKKYSSGLISRLDDLITAHSQVPGAEAKSKLLSAIKKNVQSSPTKRYSAAALEEAKRNYAKRAMYGKANRSFPAEAYGEAAGVFRKATESLAKRAADPVLRQAFLDKKAAFGPIAEVAERGQSFTGRLEEALARPSIREAAMSRLGSTAAVATDSAAKIFESAGPSASAVARAAAFAVGGGIKSAAQSVGDAVIEQAQPMIRKVLDASPELFGTYAPVLKQAAEKGNQSLAVTDFLLQQKDPEYQRLKKNLSE